MARRSAVTSTQIAREAGVAQSTVSRVLNGGSVAPETRRRVLEVLAKYDFQPSQAARSLVGTRTGLVGVVVRDLTDPVSATVVTAMDRALHDRGLRLLLVTDVLTTSEAVAVLRREGVDGVVTTRAERDDRLVPRLVGHGIPVVLCLRTLEGLPADQVDADDAACGRLVADHLLALGHRRVAMVTGVPGASTTRLRSGGFRDRVREHGAGVAVVEVAGGFDYGVAHAAVRELLAADRRPTALFCHDDVMAHAALNAATAAGVRVPAELSVVGCDDVAVSAWERIALTTVRCPLASIAETAVDLLVDRMADADAPYLHVQLPVELVTRGSTAAPPQ